MFFSNEELLWYILGKSAGNIFLDAPSMEGKSKLVKSVKEYSYSTFIMTGEHFYDFIISNCVGGTSKFNTLNNIKTHKYICIEDLDFLGGRPNTEKEMAQIINELSKTSVLIITGIELKKRLETMFDNISNYDYIKKENSFWKIYRKEES